MGYTHYWRQRREFTTQEWSQIQDQTRAILSAAKQQGLAVAYEDNEPDREPEVSDQGIRFNGVGDQGYETFLLERVPQCRGFCKTAQQPYDAVVVSVLWAAREIAPTAISLSSDGGDEVFRLMFEI